ncbi:MAG: hypothetical protein QW589_02130 [Candidatus Bathyarchaeia archaeon]
MKTLVSIALGIFGNLISRAVLVILKKKELVTKEMSSSIIHIKAMLIASQAGVVVLSAMPGFNKPK